MQLKTKLTKIDYERIKTKLEINMLTYKLIEGFKVLISIISMTFELCSYLEVHTYSALLIVSIISTQSAVSLTTLIVINISVLY